MAASAEAIAQLATAHLGNDTTISDITTSPASRPEILCSRFYATARDHLLERHPWKFATRKSLLVIHDSSDEDADLEGEWAYAFTLPTSSLRILKVLPEGAGKSLDGEDFDIYTEADGTSLLLTNVSLDETYADFIYQVTDTTKFPNYFTLALSFYLASLVASPLIGGKAGIPLANAMEQKAEQRLALAIALDSRQAQISEQYKTRYPTGILSDR